jgi:hypothetical protein
MDDAVEFGVRGSGFREPQNKRGVAAGLEPRSTIRDHVVGKLRLSFSIPSKNACVDGVEVYRPITRRYTTSHRPSRFLFGVLQTNILYVQ